MRWRRNRPVHRPDGTTHVLRFSPLDWDSDHLTCWILATLSEPTKAAAIIDHGPGVSKSVLTAAVSGKLGRPVTLTRFTAKLPKSRRVPRETTPRYYVTPAPGRQA